LHRSKTCKIYHPQDGGSPETVAICCNRLMDVDKNISKCGPPNAWKEEMSKRADHQSKKISKRGLSDVTYEKIYMELKIVSWNARERE